MSTVSALNGSNKLKNNTLILNKWTVKRVIKRTSKQHSPTCSVLYAKGPWTVPLLSSQEQVYFLVFQDQTMCYRNYVITRRNSLNAGRHLVVTVLHICSHNSLFCFGIGYQEINTGFICTHDCSYSEVCQNCICIKVIWSELLMIFYLHSLALRSDFVQ